MNGQFFSGKKLATLGTTTPVVFFEIQKPKGTLEIDFALILPSINFYLQEVGAEPGFIGVVMSAYSIAGLLFAPILGKITDYFGKVRVFTH